MKVFPIVTTTLVWKYIYYGLTVEGKCENTSCEAYHEMVRCYKGFTVFNIAEDVQCPMCKMNFKAITCGFNACQWIFEGRKTDLSSVDVMSQWNMTSRDEYKWFDGDGVRNITEWSSLIITTKELPRNDSVTPDGVRGNAVKPDCSNCALCFGTITTALTSESANAQNIAPCGHAVHSDCVMELWREGYTTCPTCRDPMAALSINSNTPRISGAAIP